MKRAPRKKRKTRKVAPKGRRIPNSVRLTSRDIEKLGPGLRAKLGLDAPAKPTRSVQKKRASSSKKKKSKSRKAPSKGQYRSFKVGRTVGRGVKSVYRGVKAASRGLVHGLKNPKQKARKRKRNPPVREVYETFRGKPMDRLTAPVITPDGTPSVLAELGKLKEIRLMGRKKPINFLPGARLGASGRKKLHIGGVRPGFFVSEHPGIETDYGEIRAICYYSDKPHIEPGRQYYEHFFGEGGGVRPRLIIDREGLPKIEGGSYTITDKGIEG